MAGLRPNDCPLGSDLGHPLGSCQLLRRGTQGQAGLQALRGLPSILARLLLETRRWQTFLPSEGKDPSSLDY